MAMGGKILENPDFMMGTMCPVHETPLKTAIIPVSYGILGWDIEYFDARTTQFPYAQTVLEGGCVQGEETHARVKYCPRCRDARARWRWQHPNVRDESGLPLKYWTEEGIR